MYRDAPGDDALASFRDDVPPSELRLSSAGVLLVRAEPVPTGRVRVHTRCRWRGLADVHASHGVGRALCVIVAAALMVAVASTVLISMRPGAPTAWGLWVMTMSGLAAVGALALGLLGLASSVRWGARMVLEHHVEHPWAERYLAQVADVAAWLVVDADGRRVARWRLRRRADTRAVAALRQTVNRLESPVTQPTVAT